MATNTSNNLFQSQAAAPPSIFSGQQSAPVAANPAAAVGGAPSAGANPTQAIQQAAQQGGAGQLMQQSTPGAFQAMMGRQQQTIANHPAIAQLIQQFLSTPEGQGVHQDMIKALNASPAGTTATPAGSIDPTQEAATVPDGNGGVRG